MAKKIANHSKLKLSFAEFGALMGTRAMLVSGALVDAKGRDQPNTKDHLFNMATACRTKECGSVACIGGTMAQIMGMGESDATDYVEGTSYPLRNLFYPPADYNYDRITKAHAVKAIDNFLKDGKPRWEKILPKSFIYKNA